MKVLTTTLLLSVSMVLSGCSVESEGDQQIIEEFNQGAELAIWADKQLYAGRSLYGKDPEAAMKMMEDSQAKLTAYNVPAKMRQAEAQVDSDAASDQAWAAMKFIVAAWKASIMPTDPPSEATYTLSELNELFKEIVAKSLDLHMAREDLADVLMGPTYFLQKPSHSHYDYVQSVWQRVLKESLHHDVRGMAAYQLAANAIDATGLPADKFPEKYPPAMMQRASMDAAAFSVPARKEYGSVIVSDGKTVEQILAGKLRKMNGLQPGKVLPDVEAKNLSGELDKLSNYRGKVVLVDFWATWCGSCVAALPSIVELKEELAGKPFEVITVSIDDHLEAILEYQEGQPMPWVNWHIGPDSKILDDWDITGVPAYYLIDEQGVIVDNSYFDDGVKEKVRKLVNAVGK